MKILHTSDIHLDSPLTSRLSYDRAKQRKKELLTGFSMLIEKAVELSCESVIISGDLFDSDSLSKKALDTALFTISSYPNIIFFYLPGNHEKNALISSGRELPKNLFIFGDEWTYFKAGSLVIAGRSRIEENMFKDLNLSSQDKNIVVLHGEPADKSKAPAAIGFSETVGKNIDYIALGHYHTHKGYRLDRRGIAVYSGTPFSRGFDECGEKGFVLLDSDSLSDYRFIPFDDRRTRVISLDVSGITDYGDFENEIQKVLYETTYKDIIRLEIIGKRSPELWIDSEEIKNNFADRFFYFEVKNSSKLSVGKDDFRFDKTLKGEFVRLVYSKEDIDEETKQRIISTGLYALLGE